MLHKASRSQDTAEPEAVREWRRQALPQLEKIARRVSPGNPWLDNSLPMEARVELMPPPPPPAEPRNRHWSTL